MKGDRLILLVDDEADFRDVLSEQLIATGDYEVIEAENSAQARVCAEQSAIDLAILDVDFARRRWARPLPNAPKTGFDLPDHHDDWQARLGRCHDCRA